MYKHHFFLVLLTFFSILLLSASSQPPPQTASPETTASLAKALSQRLHQPGINLLTFDLFTPELDSAYLNPEGTTAVLWLALRDDSGRILASEPGLALGVLIDNAWQVLLPGDPGWEDSLTALPVGMLPGELSSHPDVNASDESASLEALTGYYLPYLAGTAHRLEGSIGHFQDIPGLGYPSCNIQDCRYAYDFTDSWLFPLLASKAGVVFASRDTCTNGDPYCTNYIILRDPSNSTYQIYMHLAHNTIPDKLTNGATVLRGQYLGDIDDTGYSTSQHIHFMVADNIWLTGGTNSYYWGHSIDIRFADVLINQGIPRTCYEVTQFQIYDGATECLGSKSDPLNPKNDWYTSGNIGTFPPSGELTQPASGAVVASGSNSIMDVTAKASDDVRIAAVRLLANLEGKWIEIGPKVTQPIEPGIFDWDVDLCAVGPLNGSLEVALRVWDHEGNQSSPLSPRTIQVEHACPPPTSQLNPAQTFDSTAVYLTWTAASSGVPLGAFELQWRASAETWSPANTLTVQGNQRSAWFVGDPGGSYDFRLRALDSNEQPEAWPTSDAAETAAVLPSACTPDAFEPDDDLTQARAINLGVTSQSNLCAPENPDWFQIELENTKEWYINAPSIAGGAAVRLSVYFGDGKTPQAASQSDGIGQVAYLIFKPSQTGTFFIEVLPLQDNLSGTEAVYALTVTEAHQMFLPFIGR